MHIHVGEDLELYARRSPSEPKSPELEAHLAACPLCRAKLAASAEFSRSLAHLRREAAEMRDGHRIPTDDAARPCKYSNPVSSEHLRDVRIRDAFPRVVSVSVHQNRSIADLRLKSSEAP